MRRNVVVCCLDTVREDFFRTFAPRLRAAADVTFEGCRAASTWSTPSHASMLTGRLPSDHGVHVHAPSFRPLVGETVLDDLDHRSIGISANAYAGPAYDFDALFDEFVAVSRYRRYPDGLDPVAFVDEHADEGVRTFLELAREVATHDHPLRSLANVGCYRANDLVRHGPLGGPELFDDGAAIVARETLARTDDEPFVAFANVMDAHEPHRTVRGYDNGAHGVPDGWSSEGLSNADVIGDLAAHRSDVRNYRTLYAAAVDYLDRWAIDLLEDLEAATDRETTVVVTADHGENLAYPADDGLFGHLGSLSEGLLHVPLVLLNPPAGYPASVEGTVSHLELPRLIAGLARGETPDVTGERVASEVVGLTPSNDELSDERWDRLRRCVYEGDRKWTWDSAGETACFELDPVRPCWQRALGDGEGVGDDDWDGEGVDDDDWDGDEDGDDRPEWADDRFAVDAAEAKRVAREGARERTVDESTKRRLSELGYR